MSSPTQPTGERTERFRLGARHVDLLVADHVFRPTLTSRWLAKVARVPSGARVLDVGCGVGALAVHAALEGAASIVAVDSSAEACALARRNAELHGVGGVVDVRTSDLFTAVAGMRFDVIINDVSGVAERVARLSRWFPAGIPSGGEDGVRLQLRSVAEMGAYLTPAGAAYLPLLSLSRPGVVREKASRRFRRVETVLDRAIPFSRELIEAKHELAALRAAGVIDYVDGVDGPTWRLEIVRLGEPIDATVRRGEP